MRLFSLSGWEDLSLPIKALITCHHSDSSEIMTGDVGGKNNNIENNNNKQMLFRKRNQRQTMRDGPIFGGDLGGELIFLRLLFCFLRLCGADTLNSCEW